MGKLQEAPGKDCLLLRRESGEPKAAALGGPVGTATFLPLD